MHNVVSKSAVLGLPTPLGNANNLGTLRRTPQVRPLLPRVILALEAALAMSPHRTPTPIQQLVAAIHRLLPQVTAPLPAHQVVGTVLLLRR